MNPRITFSNVWQDDDMYEFYISSSDGSSVFNNKVYVGFSTLDELIAGLDIFKTHVHGGIYDIELGAFGSEYANGAFLARLHFQELGRVFISIRAESQYYDFGKKNIASRVELYFTTEPSFLDDFIRELKALKKGHATEAELKGA